MCTFKYNVALEQEWNVTRKYYYLSTMFRYLYIIYFFLTIVEIKILYFFYINLLVNGKSNKNKK